MSYANSGLRLLVAGVGGNANLWLYIGADAHTDVDAAGFFTDGATFGLKANDIMIVVDTSGGTCTIHRVTSATTIASATLA